MCSFNHGLLSLSLEYAKGWLGFRVDLNAAVNRQFHASAGNLILFFQLTL
jgi:hypothetical protein